MRMLGGLHVIMDVSTLPGLVYISCYQLWSYSNRVFNSSPAPHPSHQNLQAHHTALGLDFSTVFSLFLILFYFILFYFQLHYSYIQLHSFSYITFSYITFQLHYSFSYCLLSFLCFILFSVTYPVIFLESLFYTITG